MKKYIIALSGLLVTSAAYANAVFPFMVMIASINQVFSFYFLILLMLIAEFIAFIFLLPKESYLKIVIAVIIMNLASAVVGIIAHLFGDIGLIIFAEPLVASTSDKVLWYLYAAWFTLYTTLINTIIEYPIAWFFFGKIKARKLLFYIFLINAISVSIGTIGELIHQHFYGPLKISWS